MSHTRIKSRTTNNNVYLQNRLTTFLNPPMKIGDLYVEKNETVGGDLDVSGNLTVHHDIISNNFYATGNFYLDNFVLHLFSFKTPILLGKKIRKKCKINSRNFTYDGLTFSSSLFLLEDVKDEI